MSWLFCEVSVCTFMYPNCFWSQRIGRDEIGRAQSVLITNNGYEKKEGKRNAISKYQYI